jgi:hypothetical protein
MHTPDCTVTLGSDPDTGAPVEISHAAFDAGCYVIGADPQPRSTILHDWCVQWADQGHGFWYVHPRGPDPRELLARLPAHRLDDVVWIDFGRRQLAQRLDVPPVRRVGVDPLAGPAPSIDRDALEMDPAYGRAAGWVAAAGESTQHFDWNVARVLETLLLDMVGEDGLDLYEVRRHCSAAFSYDDPTALFEFVADPASERQLRNAYARDDRVFLKVSQCLSDPTDPFVSNPLIGGATYPVEARFPSSDIVLVTGALPAPDADIINTTALLGTHLLVQTLVRRLWEAAQSAPADAPPMPLVLDGLTALSPAQDVLVPALIEHSPATPLLLVLAGPELRELSERLKLPIDDALDTHVGYGDSTGPGTPPRPTGDRRAMERVFDRERSPVEAGVSCWVSTGNAGLLAGDPRTRTPTRMAQLADPPATRHDGAAIARAITDSLERHGAIADWLTDELVREARAG